MNDLSADENDYRFVAVLNKKVPIGKLMNALGHMTAGLVAGYDDTSQMRFLQYEDKDGNIHKNISHHPFIILKADNSNKIRMVRQEAIRQAIPFTDFTNTMTIGTSREQLERTKQTVEADLEYYGICLFGKTDLLRGATGKFSLFQ